MTKLPHPHASGMTTASPTTVLIQFVRVWGHPTRDIVMGVGDRARVSRWIADALIKGGYAVEIIDEARA